MKAARAQRAMRRLGFAHAVWSAPFILYYARKHRIRPRWAFALIHQESGFRNVFGHDRGSILHGKRVTKKRVAELIRHVANGGISNGVGWTQLTSLGYIMAAEKRGGAHKRRVQIDVGLEILYSKTGGDMSQAWRYNGSPVYQQQIAAKAALWKRVFWS